MRKKYEKQWGDFPRRSIELSIPKDTNPNEWEGEMVIDPLALLGASPPAKDLSMMFGKKNDRQIKCFSGNAKYNKPKFGGNLEELIKELAAICEKLQAALSENKVQEEDEPEEEQAYSEEEADKVKEEEPKPEEKVQEEEDEPENLKAQRDQARRQFSRLQADYNKLNARLSEMERTTRKAEYTAALMQLEGEGIIFSQADEIADCISMDRAQFEKHIKKMRKCYQRNMVGTRINVAPVDDSGNLPTPSEGEYQAVVQAFQRGTLSQRDALAKVESLRKGSK